MKKILLRWKAYNDKKLLQRIEKQLKSMTPKEQDIVARRAIWSK